MENFIELKGKYGTAKVFTDLVEEKALDQVRTLLDQEFIRGRKVRIMPDVHAGAGCTIGTTITILDKCCPNLVGVDIGCGMLTIALDVSEVDFDKLDRVIREHIPSGFNIRDISHPYIYDTRIDELRCWKHVDIERATRSLGTLGGGNHFIEVDQDEHGHLYLVIHSGSRHLGLEVAGYYQRLAEKELIDRYKNNQKELVEALKVQGRQSEISSELKKYKSSTINTPKELAYVSGQAFKDYIHDMEIVQEYAKWNRLAMADEILTRMGWNVVDEFETIHNYINTHSMILRKGAVSANKGEVLLIPINMRDGSLICMGKGNDDWNYSAPHGAGRLMSRAEAKKKFTVDEFADSMTGVYTTSVGNDTLDECPMAYKPMESIINSIGDTVDIIEVIRPVYNFKAGG